MENDLELLLSEVKLVGTEKLWREVSDIANELFLLIVLKKYPLPSGLLQYNITICRPKDKKWVILFEEDDMELKKILQKTKEKLKAYKDGRKEYVIQK